MVWNPRFNSLILFRFLFSPGKEFPGENSSFLNKRASLTIVAQPFLISETLLVFHRLTTKLKK